LKAKPGCHPVVGLCSPAYEDESAMDSSQPFSFQTIGQRILSIQPAWNPGKDSPIFTQHFLGIPDPDQN